MPIGRREHQTVKCNSFAIAVGDGPLREREREREREKGEGVNLTALLSLQSLNEILWIHRVAVSHRQLFLSPSEKSSNHFLLMLAL